MSTPMDRMVFLPASSTPSLSPATKENGRSFRVRLYTNSFEVSVSSLLPRYNYSLPSLWSPGSSSACSETAGLRIDELSRARMDATAKELIEEKTLAYSCLD